MKESEKESEKEAEEFERKLREVNKKVTIDLLDSLEKHTSHLPDTDNLGRVQFAVAMTALTHASATLLKETPLDHLADSIKKYVNGIVVMIAAFKHSENEKKD